MVAAANNPFPSILTAEGTTPATPAAGQQRLFVRSSDHVLCYVNSSGTVSAVSTGMSNVLTTTGDIIYSSSGTTAARLAIGAATTVLHGGTIPAYSAVVEGDLSTSDITTANATTSKHGFAPKYPNDATKYLDGTGAYTVPAGGGSAPAVSYLGYNTIGGTTEAITNGRIYMKPFTVSATGVILSMQVYIKNTSSGANFSCRGGFLWENNAGTPRILLSEPIGSGSVDTLLDDTSSGTAGLARWYNFPMNAPVTATTFWGGFVVYAGGASYQLYKDTGGGDYYVAATDQVQDIGWVAPTTTTDRYSFRFLFMATS